MSTMEHVEKMTRARTNSALSEREQEILSLLALGMTKCSIGRQLNISTHTVDYHVRSILTKLDAKNIVAAVYSGVCRGLIPRIL